MATKPVPPAAPAADLGAFLTAVSAGPASRQALRAKLAGSLAGPTTYTIASLDLAVELAGISMAARGRLFDRGYSRPEDEEEDAKPSARAPRKAKTHALQEHFFPILLAEGVRDPGSHQLLFEGEDDPLLAAISIEDAGAMARMILDLSGISKKGEGAAKNASGSPSGDTSTVSLSASGA